MRRVRHRSLQRDQTTLVAAIAAVCCGTGKPFASALASCCAMNCGARAHGRRSAHACQRLGAASGVAAPTTDAPSRAAPSWSGCSPRSGPAAAPAGATCGTLSVSARARGRLGRVGWGGDCGGGACPAAAHARAAPPPPAGWPAADTWGTRAPRQRRRQRRPLAWRARARGLRVSVPTAAGADRHNGEGCCKCQSAAARTACCWFCVRDGSTADTWRRGAHRASAQRPRRPSGKLCWRDRAALLATDAAARARSAARWSP
jgi:hypothetical protein